MYWSWPKLEKIGETRKIDQNEMKIKASKSASTSVSYMSVPTAMGDFILGASAFGVASMFFPGVEDFDIIDRSDFYGLASSSYGKKMAVEAGLELMGYAVNEVSQFSSPIDLSYLTDFGQDVLLALSKVSFGKTVTISELADLAGHPRKYAPVANVVKHNPLPIFIPCHRVMPSRGIGDWSGGPETKRFLLEHEGIEATLISA